MEALTMTLLRHGLWLSLGAGVSLVALGYLLERALGALRRDRRWRTRTEGLRPLHARADPGARGTMRGSLVVERPAVGFDGGHCGVATVVAGPGLTEDAARASVRAAHVWLEVDGARVELRGPIEAVAGPGRAVTPDGHALERIVAASGAQQEWAFTTLPVVLRQLEAGAEVEVAGRLTRDADATGATYRDGGGERALKPSGDRLLIRRVGRSTPWRGPLLAAATFVALVGLGPMMTQAHWPRLVSPFHRGTEVARLRALLSRPSRELSADDALLRAELLGEGEHAARARLLREAGRAQEALIVAEQSTSLAARREQVVCLLAVGRDRDAAARWIALIESIDAECEANRDCFRAIDTLGLLTPQRWGARDPQREPIDVYFSRAGLAHDPGYVLRVSEMLEGANLESPLLIRMRVGWLVERARYDLLNDHGPQARVVLARARDSAASGRLTPATRRTLLRRIDHLEAVAHLRERRVHDAHEIADRHAGTGFCPLDELVSIAEGDVGLTYYSLPREQVAAVREAARSRTTQIGSRASAADLRAAAIYGHQLDGRSRDALRAAIGSTACRRDLAPRDLIRMSARASALESVGGATEAHQLRHCVAATRGRLLGRELLAAR